MTQITYTVKGRGPFPIDMIRYDGSYPAQHSDAADIQGSISNDPGNPVSTANREPWEIDLITNKRPGVPCVGRWASFMVKVTMIDGRAQ